MGENKNGKKAIWMYAVILFTSAFIVLLLTAISQIKFNKNIDEYKTQISDQEKAKNNFYLNLNSALQENKKLTDELGKTRDELTKVKSSDESKAKDLANLNSKSAQTTASYEALLIADDAYRKGDLVACAIQLSQKCNSSLLGQSALDKYKSLVEKTFLPAAKKLYLDGYNNYKKGKYADAIYQFTLSIDIVPNEYYTDDCYFFIAYSQYKLGKTDLAKAAVQTLLQKFPESSYAGDANDLLLELKG